MDVKNVFVIMGRGTTKQMIVDDIIEEGYKHNFFFEQGQDWDVLERNIKLADEVWCFKDCSEYDSYKYAIKNGLDVWIMG